MSNFRIAQRYAKALLDLAKEREALDAVFSDIQVLKNVLDESSELKNVFISPIVTEDKKIAIIDAIFGKEFNTLTIGFIKLLVKKKRDYCTADVCVAFVAAYRNEMSIGTVTITAAAEMSQEMVKSISDKVQASVGKNTMEVTTQVDADLIGGFIVEFGDKRYDASVASALTRLEKDFDNKEYINNI